MFDMKTKSVLPILLASLMVGMPPNASACTIAVLTDTNHMLFCNNEDWSNQDL